MYSSSGVPLCSNLILMKSCIQILFLLLVFAFSLNAQSPYEFSFKKESIIIGTSALTMGTGFAIHFNMEPLSEEEISTMTSSNIGSFDLKATKNYSFSDRSRSDICLMSSYALPALFLAHKKTRSDFGAIAILYGETLFAVKGITNVTKRSVKRPRPFVYNPDVPLSEKTKLQARFSFFSGHTSITAANSFMVAKIFSDYFPESELKPYVWTAAAVLPAATGYFRVKAGKHYPTDVITGYAVGAAIGILIPHFHKKRKNDSSNAFHFDASFKGFKLAYTF